MNTKPQRLKFVDMVKGLSIIMVVCYHLLAPSAFKTDVLNHFMFPFLAAFFIFSGYFYKPGKRTYAENVKARAKALLLPFVIYGVIFWFIASVYMLIVNQITVVEALACLRNFFAGCIWNRVIQNWFGWEYYSLGSRYMFLAGFWFLPALFFASVIFFPIADRTLDSAKKSITAAAGLFLLSGVLRIFKVDLPYNWQLVPFWAGFMLLGALSRTKSLFELPAVDGAKGWAYALVSMAAGLAIGFWREPVLNNFRGTFPEPEFLSMVFCILASILFVWGLGNAFRMIETTGVRVTELAWVGENSMTIYLFHYFFAWVLSIIFGLSLRYTEPLEPGFFAKSAALTAASFALCVLYAIVQNKIKEQKAISQ